MKTLVRDENPKLILEGTIHWIMEGDDCQKEWIEIHDGSEVLNLTDEITSYSQIALQAILSDRDWHTIKSYRITIEKLED